MRKTARCVLALAVVTACALPSSASANHCPPVPTLVSFEPDYEANLPTTCNQALAPYTFEALEEGAGSFERVRPNTEEPLVPNAAYAGKWAARIERTSSSGAVYGEKTVDWIPEVSTPPILGADAYYQGRFYLKTGFIQNLPDKGVYLVRWENTTDPPNDEDRECGGLILSRNGTSTTEAKLHVVRQRECQQPTPPDPVAVVSSQGVVREREWVPVWVNQKLSPNAATCGPWVLPSCAGAYTATTLGNEPVQFKPTPNYDDTEAANENTVLEKVVSLRYGIMPIPGSSGGGTLELLADCLGQSDSCAQEFPIRAALYDPLVSDAWGPVGDRNTDYEPTRGYYTFDAATIDGHIRSMQYAGFQGGLSTWEGADTVSDQRLETLLDAAEDHGGGFRWAINYTDEETQDPNPSADLNSLVPQFAHPNYLHAQGKPVIFVSASAADRETFINGCDMVQRWHDSGATFSYHVVMPEFEDFDTEDCPNHPWKPASWHNFALDGTASQVNRSSGLPYSYSISPGYQKESETGARLPRDFLRWTKNVQDMVNSKADWQLAPFNHWIEGAATESAMEWTSPSTHGFYLDTLHADGQPVHKIIVAAGDIACGNYQPSGHCHERDTSDLFIEQTGVDPQTGMALWDTRPGVAKVLAIGDTQYHCGAIAQFRVGADPATVTTGFDPTWGRVRTSIAPVPGNHEYTLNTGMSGTDGPCDAAASGYFDYFSPDVTGPPAQAWRFHSLGPDWQFIGLNSMCVYAPFPCRPPDGCATSTCSKTAQEQALKDHLETLPASSCVLSYWHHPRGSSERLINYNSQDGLVRELMRLLYEHPSASVDGGGQAVPTRGDIVLNGHDHLYERFHPRKEAIGGPYGVPVDDGIRQFIVGTGGLSVRAQWNNPDKDAPAGQSDFHPHTATARLNNPNGLGTYGVLQMVLYDRPSPAEKGGYSWQFAPEARLYTPPSGDEGSIFQDSGAAGCN